MTEKQSKQLSQNYDNAYPHYVRPCEASSGFSSCWVIVSYLKDCIRVIGDDSFDKCYKDMDNFNRGTSL